MSSVMEFLNSIPTFDGSQKCGSIMEYFSKFEEIAKRFNWASDKKLFFVKYRLEGEAKNHVSKMSNLKDYDALKNSLIEQFYKGGSNTTKKAQLLNQPMNMSANDFIVKTEKFSFAIVNNLMASSKQSMSPESVVAFRSKIERDILLSKMHPQVIKRVLRRHPQNLKEIKHFAIQEEGLLNSVGTSNAMENETEGSIESLNDKIKKLDTQVTTLADKINYLEKLLNGPIETLNK